MPCIEQLETELLNQKVVSTDATMVDFSGVAPEGELSIAKLAPAKQANKWIFSIREDTLCYPETNIFAVISYIRDLAEHI